MGCLSPRYELMRARALPVIQEQFKEFVHVIEKTSIFTPPPLPLLDSLTREVNIDGFDDNQKCHVFWWVWGASPENFAVLGTQKQRFPL